MSSVTLLKQLFIFFVLMFFAGAGYGQIKLYEGFESANFPPAGWSIADFQGTGSRWAHTGKYTGLGLGCAVSGFDTTGGNSFIITKRFVPAEGDSLVFLMKQAFFRSYSDTFKVLASSADSLPSSMTDLLLSLRDGLNYPNHHQYKRYSISLNQYAGDTIWIGFNHLNLNGDILRIDEVRVGEGLQNDVGITAVTAPDELQALCSYDSLSPGAVITNSGLGGQSQPFIVQYRITGPQYFEGQVLTSVLAGESKELAFPAFNPEQPGDYSMKVFSSLATDQNRSNDTMSFSFRIKQYTADTATGGYYFASSLNCGQLPEITPTYFLKDTSGSAVLLKDGQDVSGGLFNGDPDNGYFALGGFLPQGKSIRFMDALFDSLFISTNGLICFRRCAILDTPSPTDSVLLPAENRFAVAPFWTDMDFSFLGGSNLISYKVTQNGIIVNYFRAGIKGGNAQDYLSLQANIQFVDTGLQNSKIIVQFSAENSGLSFLERMAEYSEGTSFSGILSPAGSFSVRKNESGIYAEKAPLFKQNMALEYGPDPAELDSRPSDLHLRVLLEAMVNMEDTIEIVLHDNVAPFAHIESIRTVLNDSGFAEAAFTIPGNETGFLIAVRHRNSIETWSKEVPQYFTNYQLEYDFTSDVSQAYGNNMILVNGRARFYCGDVDQNYVVDLSDLTRIGNDVDQFATGYIATDMNGDGIVDSSDLIHADNNAGGFVSARVPEGSPIFSVIRERLRQGLSGR